MLDYTTPRLAPFLAHQKAFFCRLPVPALRYPVPLPPRVVACPRGLLRAGAAASCSSSVQDSVALPVSSRAGVVETASRAGAVLGARAELAVELSLA